MSEYEATGRTLDEAVEKALSYLGIRKENAIIEVLSEPNQGILGLLGNKGARIFVRPSMEAVDYLKSYLQRLLQHMDIDGRVKIEENEDMIKAEIFGKDVGPLIGRHGKVLGDLQYILNIILRRQYTLLNKMVVLDIENYRSRREKTLTQLAKSVARKVCTEGQEQELEPMTSQERRIIHVALQNYSGVTTYSAGEEPYRKVVIAPR